MNRGATSSWFDLTAVLVIVLGGLVFLWDARGWASWAYIGNDQYGDADFWWRGALQFSQGFFSDNINISFRMGYAVFSGLLVAVFGSDYAVFHKLLVLIFLGVVAAGYLVLLHRVGRPTALAVTMALVFSPYQAEWLSISTSDALGLIGNLTALLAFCAAFDESIRLKWLALGGIFLALGALTRDDSPSGCHFFASTQTKFGDSGSSASSHDSGSVRVSRPIHERLVKRNASGSLRTCAV